MQPYKIVPTYMFIFATAILLWAMSSVTTSAAQINSWIGFTTINGTNKFFRVSPQFFSGPELYFHNPVELVFNQQVQNFSVSNTEISFDVVGKSAKQIQSFTGSFDGVKYAGAVLADRQSGSFELYRVAAAPGAEMLTSYAGTYMLANNVYRTVGFEDLAGMIGTRLFYSDNENFVLMYPLSSTEFMTSFGEKIRFEQHDGTVSEMKISLGTTTHFKATKISPFTQEEVQFKSSDATLSGTLMLPNSQGPHPAVIIAHSSVIGERHAYWIFASHFARDGIAVLTYDRRGHGASTGGEPFNLNTNLLAADMKAGFEFLQTHPSIDPHNIGLMGFSNGSWVAPLAAQALPDVAFISVSMASAVSQVEAELFRRESVLKAIGVSPAARELAVNALKLYYQGAVHQFSNSDKAEFSRLYNAILENKELRNVHGFQILPTDQKLDQILASSGSLAWMDYSPSQTYRSLEVPISFHIGELDENISPQISIAVMNDVMAEHPNADINVAVYPDATHGLFVLPNEVQGISQDIIYPNLAHYEFAPGYLPELRAWLQEKSGTRSNR